MSKPPINNTNIPHQLSFSLPQGIQQHISEWINTVAQFYMTVLGNIDVQLYNQLITNTLRERAKLAEQEADQDEEENNEKETAKFDEAIESVTVRLLVQLVSILGHYSSEVRVEAALLVSFLSEIMIGKSLNQAELSRILASLETNETGYYDCVHALFKLVGQSFSVMAIAIISGLELYNNSADWRVRGICNCAIAQLVNENQQKFIHEDRLAAIWNLYFLLGLIPSISPIFPDRVVIIDAMLLLAPIYSVENHELSTNIVSTLMLIQNKTDKETKMIKDILDTVFKNASDTTKVESELEKPRHEYPQLFLEIISSQQESACDLLSWAIENYFMAMEKKKVATATKVSSPETLQDFFYSLSNHFKSSPSLIRYSSALALLSIINICPSFATHTPQVWQYIIPGLMDSDFMTKAVYLTISNRIETVDSEAVRQIASKLSRNEGSSNINYDQFYNISYKWENDSLQSTYSQLMDLLAKNSPPLGGIMLHKLANALDYIPVSLKLKQLELIRVWGRKATKLDMYLMQTLVPLCSDENQLVQLHAIKAVDALLPGITNPSANDIYFLWKYMSALLDPNIDSKVIIAGLELLKKFPLQQLSVAARDELLVLLYGLVFSSNKSVRRELYTFIGSVGEYWKSFNLIPVALSILFLSLGDGTPSNVKWIIEKMTELGGSYLSPILLPLGKIRDSVGVSPLAQMRLYDQLSTAMAVNKVDLRALIDAIAAPARVDKIWAFYLASVPDNQLARPEEYNFDLNNIHNPIWVALLYTKFSIPPPPLGDASARRDVIPTTPMGKRRYICGFMQCLFPSLGSWNPIVRQPSSIATLVCCFKGANGTGEMIRGLLEFITQQFLVSKYITYQLSAIEIFAAIIRLKIPGISEAVFQQYFDLCMELLHNAHSPILLVSILGLFEIFLLVFPKGMSSKLQETRDITRSFLGNRNPSVVNAAARIYPLIFRAVSLSNAQEFEDFLRNEIKLLQNPTSLEAVADPIISHLSQDEIQQILALSIYSLGLITDTRTPYFETAQYLLQFLKHPKAIFRINALASIINLISVMDSLETTTIVWILLPLFADLNYNVRLLWSKFRRNVQSFIVLRTNAVLPHPDDNPILPIITWEDILTDHSTLAVNTRYITDLSFHIDDLIVEMPYTLPPEDECFHLPTISKKLMERFKELVQSMVHTLPQSSQEKVLYHLNMYSELPHLHGPMILVLCEFGILHDDLFEETAGRLLSNLSCDLNTDNKSVLEASIAGLANILDNSRAMANGVMEKITTNSILAEGDLIAMVYLFEFLRNLSATQITMLVANLCSLTSSSRHAQDKRIFAAHLAAEFSLIGGPEGFKDVLDSFQTLLESIPIGARAKVYRVAGRLLVNNAGERHPLFRSMAVQAKKFLKSKNAQDRLQSLEIYRIFAKNLQNDESMSFLFYFLADCNYKIRETAKNIILEDSLIDFALADVRKLSPVIGPRDSILELATLPCMGQVAIQVNTASTKEEENQEFDANADPFNVKYFKSKKRIDATQRYGMNEALFANAMEPVTQSILDFVEKKILNGVSSTVQPLNEEELEALKKIRPLSILKVLVKFSPMIAERIVSEILYNLEEVANIVPHAEGKTDLQIEEDKDVGMMSIKISLLSNLLVAFGTEGEYVQSWIQRLQNIISVCCNVSAKLRESLYFDMEQSFYFANQFADIPIISDEQIAAIQELRDLSQEAILDVVKSGKTEKVDLIDNKNDQWNGEVDSESDYLRILTILSQNVLAGYGLYYILTEGLSEYYTCEAFKFMSKLIDEEHRGFRMVVIDALVYLVAVVDNLSSREQLQPLVKSFVIETMDRMEKENYTLFRKKADFASTAAQLIIHFEEREMQQRILRLLIELWRDPDSEVRSVAINMVQHLGEKQVKEVLEGFTDHTGVENNDTINIMKEAVILGNMEDYPDKDLLQGLLKWRFSTQSEQEKVKEPLPEEKELAVVPVVETEPPTVPVEIN
ncbi:hypothetical protein HDV06_006928 [Boothiomyces sp. JEL0866]|nr:hypothetical protein HDV06_006928 [Boothiomyces sp. JEL0866]